MKKFSTKSIILASLVLALGMFAPFLLHVIHAQSASQTTVNVGTNVSFYASGGNGGSGGNGYAWSAPSSFTPSSGSGVSFNSTPQQAGNAQVVTVKDSSGNSASCIVNVTSTPSTPGISCSPATASITRGGTVQLSSQGGSGNDTWSAPSFTPASISGQKFSAVASTVGTSLPVTVTDSAGDSASCAVTVVCGVGQNCVTKQGLPAGTISANPNPCTIASGQTTCLSNITWSTSNVSANNVYVAVSAPGLPAVSSPAAPFFSAGEIAATQGASWITTHGYTFTLYDCSGVSNPSSPTGCTSLARATVTGVASGGNACSAGPSITSFTANGGTNIQVNPGADPVTYQWSSSNGTSFQWSAHDENGNSIPTCDSANPGFSFCDTASGIINSGPISASAIDHTYTVTFSASALSCAMATKSITVSVVATTPTSTYQQYSWLCWDPPTPSYVCVNVGGPHTGDIVPDADCVSLPQPSCGTTTQTHLECKNNSCAKVAGAGTDQCTNDGNCGPGSTHLACVNHSCATVSGSGTDQCADNNNCVVGATHYVCINNACGEVIGSGPNQCNSDNDCIISDSDHSVCVGDACTLVLGAGKNQCTTDSNCGSGSTHLACVNHSCATVSGSAANACTTNADCGPGGGPSHFVCENYACKSVSGLGTNQCISDSDCNGGGTPQWSCNALHQDVCLENGTTVTGCTGPEPDCSPGGSSVSCALSASPSTILLPGRSTLQWSCQNAVSCTMTPSGQAVNSGSSNEIVSPGATTVYTLTCVNAANAAGSFQTTVTVQPNPTVSETNP